MGLVALLPNRTRDFVVAPSSMGGLPAASWLPWDLSYLGRVVFLSLKFCYFDYRRPQHAMHRRYGLPLPLPLLAKASASELAVGGVD